MSPLDEGGGSSWVPTDGALFQFPDSPEVFAYFQGRRFLVTSGDVATAIWGVGWPSLIQIVSLDWRTLTRGRDIRSADDWAAIVGGDWQPPPPSPEDPNYQPEPDDPNEENWAFYGENILQTIYHEFGVLSSAIGRGIPNLVEDARSYRLELRKQRKQDWNFD